jgi:diguanylate cyclase (GGDEF)-like protein
MWTVSDRIKLNFKWHGAAFITAVLVFILFHFLIELQNQKYKAEEALRSSIYGNLLWTEVDRELNSLLFISNGLASYITVYQDELKPEKINLILEDLWLRSKHVRNLGVAVGYRLTYVYPEAGNKKIIGVDFRNIPTQWAKVKQAIDTQQGVLDGPIQLIQGGQGIVYRYPIFIEGKYWGIISTVIDTDKFLKAAFKNAPNKHEFAIRNVDTKNVFYGDAKLFSDKNTFKQTSLVPNGKWEWAIKNHTSHYADQILIYQIISVFISLVSGFLAYYLLKDRYRLSEDAMLDSLTNLPNRRLLNDRMEIAFHTAKRFQKMMAIMAVDIDYFKSINDTYGHDFGDEVLRAVALFIKSNLRETDTVSRVGGDEFVVVLREVNSIQNIVAIADKLKSHFTQPIVILGKVIPVHLSIGISIYNPERHITLKQLTKEADIALYQSKAKGRNTYSIFETQ